MSESARSRFPIDLDEIEKQLSAQPQPASHGRADPLAELARIVGQDDPFQTLLAADRKPPRAANEGSLDDLFVHRDERRSAEPALRSAFADHDPSAGHRAADPYAQVGASYAEYQAKVEAEGDYDPNLALSYYADSHAEPEAPKGRAGGVSRKVVITAGSIGVVAVLGLGSMFLLQGPTAMSTGGEPPLIKANNEPSKVPPLSPGGVEIPNQNKQIYEGNRESQTKVVNREEQPVDVRQAARQAAPAAPPPPAAQPAAPVAGAGLNLGEPRRVRTVTIRPDGTIVTSDQPPAAPASATAPAAAAAPQLPPTLPAAAQAPARTQPTMAPTTPAPRTVPTTPAPAAVAGGASPQPTIPAAAPTAPQRVATAQPLPLPAAPTPAAAAISEAAAGGFAVQLGVSPSEADARTTLQRLQQRYPELGGATPLIRKAEVNGNTVFRVRVGPMTRDDASALCSKLQGQGGQCFVAKN
ncbi:MAG TPA: SPOR domain-containing protein [Microvirga sp.]|jgi:hypothetical protein|nr:SPOR domain-containing protein [Microvirga sp.]